MSQKGVQDAPHSDELDVNINGERLLEGGRLRPAGRIVPSIHLVRKRHLLVIAWWEETDFMDHARERSRRVGTAREAKDEDLVADAVYVGISTVL